MMQQNLFMFGTCVTKLPYFLRLGTDSGLNSYSKECFWGPETKPYTLNPTPSMTLLIRVSLADPLFL